MNSKQNPTFTVAVENGSGNLTRQVSTQYRVLDQGQEMELQMDNKMMSILPVQAEKSLITRVANDASVSLKSAVPKLRLGAGGLVNIQKYRDANSQRSIGSFFSSVFNGVKEVVSVGKDVVSLGSSVMAMVNPEGGIDQQYSESTAPQGQLEAQETITRTFEHIESRAGAVVDAIPVPGRKEQRQDHEEVMPQNLQVTYRDVAMTPSYFLGGTGVLSSSDTPFSILKKIPMIDILEGTSNIAAAIESWTLVRWESIRIELTMSSPRQALGLYFVSFIPGTRATEEPNSALLTRALSSNRADLNVAYQSSATIDCPYVSIRPAIATSKVIGQYDYLGSIIIGCISQVNGAAGTIPDIPYRMKVAIQGFQGAWHQPASAVTRRIKVPMQVQSSYKKKAEEIKGDLDLIEEQLKQIKRTLNSWEADTEGRRRAMALNSGIVGLQFKQVIALANELYTYYRDLEPCQSMAHIEDRIRNLEVTMRNKRDKKKPQIRHPMFLQMDEGNVINTHSDVVYFPRLPNAQSYEPGTLLGQRSHLGHEPESTSPSSVDEMDMLSIATRWGPHSLNTYTWTTSMTPGQVIASIPVEPRFVQAAFPSSPLEYVATMATFWRGSLRYRVHVIANGFYSGALACFIQPPSPNPQLIDTADPGSYPNVMIDIRDKATFTIRAGYEDSNQVRFVNKYNVNVMSPILIISVANPLVTTAGMPNSIQLYIEEAGYAGDENGNGRFQLFNLDLDPIYTSAAPAIGVPMGLQSTGQKTGTMIHEEEEDFLIGYDLPLLVDPPQQLEPFTHLMQLLERIGEVEQVANTTYTIIPNDLEPLLENNAFWVVRQLFTLWNGSTQVTAKVLGTAAVSGAYSPGQVVGLPNNRGLPYLYMDSTINGALVLDLPFATSTSSLPIPTGFDLSIPAGNLILQGNPAGVTFRVTKKAGANLSMFYWAGIPTLEELEAYMAQRKVKLEKKRKPAITVPMQLEMFDGATTSQYGKMIQINNDIIKANPTRKVVGVDEGGMVVLEQAEGEDDDDSDRKDTKGFFSKMKDDFVRCRKVIKTFGEDKVMQNMTRTMVKVSRTSDKLGGLIDSVMNFLNTLGGEGMCDKLTMLIIDLVESIYLNVKVKWAGFALKVAAALGISGFLMTKFREMIYPIIDRILRPKEQRKATSLNVEMETQMKSSYITGMLAITIIGLGVVASGGATNTKKAVSVWDMAAAKGQDISNITRGVSSLKTTVKVVQNCIEDLFVTVFGDEYMTEGEQFQHAFEREMKEHLELMKEVYRAGTKRKVMHDPEVKAKICKIHIFRASFIGYFTNVADKVAQKRWTPIVYALTQFAKDYPMIEENNFTRLHPFEVSFGGASRIGKSHISMALCKVINKSQKRKPNDIYQINDTIDHFDNYTGQYCVQVDDKDTVLDPEIAKGHINRMSGVPIILPMADLTDKGIYFESKFIATTTNTMYPKITGLAHNDAYLLRRNMVFETILKKGRTHEYDFSHLEFQQMDNTDSTRKIGPLLSAKEMMRKVLIEYSQHMVKQSKAVRRLDPHIKLDPLYVYQEDTPHHIFESLFEQMASEKDPIIELRNPESIFSNIDLNENIDLPETVYMTGTKSQTIEVPMHTEMWAFTSMTARKPVEATERAVKEWKEDAHGILDQMNETRNVIRKRADEVEERLSLPTRLAFSTMDMLNTGLILGSNIGIYLIESSLQLLMSSSIKILIWLAKRLQPMISIMAKILGIFLIIWSAIKLFKWLKHRIFDKEEEVEETESKTEEKEELEEKEEVIIKPATEAQSYDKTNYKKQQPKTTLKGGKVISVPMQKEALDKNHAQEVDSLKRSIVIINIEGRESNAILLGEHWILTPRHIVEIKGSAFELTITRGGLSFSGFIRKKDIRYGTKVKDVLDYKSDSYDAYQDFAIFNARSTGIPASKKIINHFASSNELGRADGCPATLLTREADGFERSRMRKIISIGSYCHEPSENNEQGIAYCVLEGWKYHEATRVGQCGSPLIVDNPHINGKVVGIHVSGGKKHKIGLSVLLCREIIEGILPEITKPMMEGNGVDTGEMELQCTGGLQPTGNQLLLGYLPQEESLYQMDKTDLKESPIHDVLFKHTKEPAVLSPKDSRFDHQYPTPRARGMDKFGKGFKPLNMINMTKIRNVMIHKLVNYIKDKPLGILTIEEAINGIPGILEGLNVRTSPGYPYTLLKPAGMPGKLGYLTNIGTEQTPYYTPTPYMKGEIEKVLRTYVEGGETYCNYYADCLKDELRSLEKVRQGKTRTFNNCNMAQLVVRTMLYGRLLSYYKDMGLEMQHALGLDIFGTGMSDIQMELNNKNASQRINYDVEQWDGKAMRAVLIHSAWETLSQAEFIITRDVELYRTRQRNAYACTQRIHVNGNIVYEAYDGEASGDKGTIEINSIAHVQAEGMVYLDLAEEAGIKKTAEDFFEEVAAAFMGDDATLAPIPYITSWYNPDSVQRGWFNTIGCTLTDPKKNPNMRWLSPFEADFLKCVPVRDGKFRYFASIDEETIQELFNWIRPSENETEEETMAVHVKEAFKFAFHHGRQYYDNLATRYNRVAKEYGQVIWTKPYDDLYDEWLENFQ